MAGSSSKKSSKSLRVFLSFVIFLLLVVFSFSACSGAVFTNAKQIEKAFVSYEYVSGLRDNIIDYTNDVYVKNGISNENVDDIFEYSLVSDISRAYINSNISHDSTYSQTSYLAYISDICANLKADIKNQLDKTNVDYKEKDVDNTIKVINDYFVSELDVPYVQQIKTVTNIGPIVSVVLMVFSTVFTAVLFAITYFVGQKRYRALRAVSIGFLSAGIYDLLMSLVAVIIMKFKHVDVFPLYLRNMFNQFVNLSISSVAFTGLMLVFCALIIIVGVWKLKKKDK